MLNTLRATTTAITAKIAPQMIIMRLFAYRLLLDKVGTLPLSGLVSSMEGFLNWCLYSRLKWLSHAWGNQQRARRTGA
jgi:hypothetical protein